MPQGRPATPLGTWGEIHTVATASGKVQASCYLRLHNGQTKRVRATGTSKTAATNKLKERCRTMLATTDTNTLTSTSTLTALLDYWLTEHECATSSKKAYRGLIGKHIAPALGGVRLNELSPLLLQKFLHSLPPAASHNCRTVLSSALSLATRYGLVDHNPVRETTPTKRIKKETRALTANELDAYRHLVHHYQYSSPSGQVRAPWLLNFIDVLAGTGARRGEILALTWADIDLETSPPVAIIRPTKDKGKSTRYVQLPALAVAALQRQQDLCPAALFIYVFASTPDRPLSFTAIDRAIHGVRATWESWGGVLLDTGTTYKPVLNWVTCHTFRKTMATLLANSMGEDVASRQLGHSTTGMTRTYYIAAPREGLPIVDTVNAFMALPTPA